MLNLTNPDMKKMTRLLLCLLGCALLIPGKLRADVPIKFGKISMEEMTATVCPIDSNAYAYVIADVGTSTFRYASTTVRSDDPSSGQKGFQLNFKRTVRLKILKKEGFNYGNIEIPLYFDNEDKEKLLGLKAFTYNMVAGKVEKTKLEQRDIKTEQSGEHLNTVKFAMPNLQEGSVVEYEYEVQSDFYFNLQEWYFQRSIPVLCSNYYVAIPEYFNYNQSTKGYFPISVKQDRTQQKLTLTYIQRNEGMSQQGYTSTQTIDYVENSYEYTGNNIPAFPNEKYLRTAENYLSKVEFELASTKFPNSVLHLYSTTWDAIDTKLKESYTFGKELGRANHLEEAVAKLKATGLKDTDLLNAALKYMQRSMNWNGKKSYFANTTLAKAFKEGEGNCADINLNLINLLSELGFRAYPLLLSTRENGIILLGRPSLSRFNYVVAYVEIGNSYHLLDATDPVSSVDLLPVRCLNDKGRIYGPVAERWIELHSFQPYVSKSFAVFELDKDLNFTGQILKKLEGYAAYSFKSNAKAASSIEEYVKTFEDENSKVQLSELKIPNLDSVGLKMQIGYKLANQELVSAAGDLIYLNANYEPFYDENPLKLDKRDFPVEFNYPVSLQRSCTIKLLEGMEVSELPQSIAIQLPNSSGSFTYQCAKGPSSVQINTTLNIRKDLFLPEEYLDLKKFIQTIIEKQNEMIVLKAI